MTIQLQPAELHIHRDNDSSSFSNVLGFAPSAHVNEVYTNPSFPRLPRDVDSMGMNKVVAVAAAVEVEVDLGFLVLVLLEWC